MSLFFIYCIVNICDRCCNKPKVNIYRQPLAGFSTERVRDRKLKFSPNCTKIPVSFYVAFHF